MNPFKVNGEEIQNRNIGGLEKPHLYAITAGQRNAGTNGSLIFHIKIGDKYHQLCIDKTNKTSVSLYCVHYKNGGCRARHKFRIDPRFVQTKVDTDNWEVISHQTTCLYGFVNIDRNLEC